MADELRALVFEASRGQGPAGTSQSPGAEPGPWGWIGLVASDRGLRLLILPRPARAAALEAAQRYYPDTPVLPIGGEAAQAEPDAPGSAATAILLAAAGQLRAYLAGDQQPLSVPLDLRGHTPFALAVWEAARRIPYGQTRTYRWIADQVGGGGYAKGVPSGGIYQAVGAALGSNPVPLIIPCHRVIGSDGGLHGYAGGLDMKAHLLAMESGQAAFGWQMGPGD